MRPTWVCWPVESSAVSSMVRMRSSFRNERGQCVQRGGFAGPCKPPDNDDVQAGGHGGLKIRRHPLPEKAPKLTSKSSMPSLSFFELTNGQQGCRRTAIAAPWRGNASPSFKRASERKGCFRRQRRPTADTDFVDDPQQVLFTLKVTVGQLQVCRHVQTKDLGWARSPRNIVDGVVFQQPFSRGPRPSTSS